MGVPATAVTPLGEAPPVELTLKTVKLGRLEETWEHFLGEGLWINDLECKVISTPDNDICEVTTF